jgi:hypothetical protein
MRDHEALEILRADIRKLFPPGPARERWLAWSARTQIDEHSPPVARAARADARISRRSADKVKIASRPDELSPPTYD